MGEAGLPVCGFLVLTHNIEFMSILIRNKIVDGRFILEKSNIKVLQKELIMPYEEHLRDVYYITIISKIFLPLFNIMINESKKSAAPQMRMWDG